MTVTPRALAPVFVMLTLAPALIVVSLATGTAAAPQVVDKTTGAAVKAKDAVVRGVTVGAGKTKDGLSKTGEVMTDEWITARIHSRFVGDDLLDDSHISVDVSRHVVTLRGTVTAGPGRARAASIARDTEGVERVVNHLMIGPKHKK
jgi:osmotically-inducible protein OsmY